MPSLCALYYPYHPSDGQWLRHALLYYDYVGTTVPTSFENELDACKLPEYLRQLRDDNQYLSVTDTIGFAEVCKRLAKIDQSFAFAAIPLAEDFAFSVCQPI